MEPGNQEPQTTRINLDVKISLIGEMADNFHSLMQLLVNMGKTQEEALGYIILKGVKSEMDHIGSAFCSPVQNIKHNEKTK